MQDTLFDVVVDENQKETYVVNGKWLRRNEDDVIDGA